MKQQFKSPYVRKPLRKDAVFHAFDLTAADWPTRLVARRAGSAIDLVHTGEDFPRVSVDNKTEHFGEFDGLGFRIGIRSNGPWPHMTFLHETGHGVAFYLLDEMWGDRSASSLLFEDWRKAVDESPRIKGLRQILPEGSYLIRYPEIFARAYAQHIAIKSRDPIIIDELNKIQDHNQDFVRAWPDDEFGPISIQIDRVLTYRVLK